MSTIDINQIPEECVSSIISLTSPRSACLASAVSTAFKSAADSDAAWCKFLPTDCTSLLSRAVDLVQYDTKKELFFRLAEEFVLIDGGKMGFGLERESGKKKFTVSARAMYIVWGEDERYWKFVHVSDSRFSEAAELLDVCWLEICCKIESEILSFETTYTTHLIFKLSESSNGFTEPPMECTITINGHTVCSKSFRLQTNANFGGGGRRRGFHGRNRIQWFRTIQENVQENETLSGNGAKEREDGWMEIEIGEFRIGEDGEKGEVVMSLTEVKGGHWKRGLIVREIEIRPKN